MPYIYKIIDTVAIRCIEPSEELNLFEIADQLYIQIISLNISNLESCTREKNQILTTHYLISGVTGLL